MGQIDTRKAEAIYGQYFNQSLRNHRPLSTRGRDGFLKACRQKNIGRDMEK